MQATEGEASQSDDGLPASLPLELFLCIAGFIAAFSGTFLCTLTDCYHMLTSVLACVTTVCCIDTVTCIITLRDLSMLSHACCDYFACEQVFGLDIC